MTREQRMYELFQALSTLVDETGRHENTSIYPNAEVINATPADLPDEYIIVKDEQGFYIPALKIPGLTYNDGDFVNILYVKGTEPIAFQQGTGSTHTNCCPADQIPYDTDAYWYWDNYWYTIPDDVSEALDALIELIKNAGGGGGGDFLTTDGATVGATAQAQEFTNGIKLTQTVTQIVTSLAASSDALLATVKAIRDWYDALDSIQVSQLNDATSPPPTAQSIAGTVYILNLALSAGATVNDIATTVGDPGADDTLVTEQGIREAIDAIGSGVWPDQGEVKIGSTTYADLPTAYAAAGAGDVIKLGEGTFTLAAALVSTKDITILGTDKHRTIITHAGTAFYTISLQGATKLVNLTVRHTGLGDSGSAAAVNIDDDNAQLYNVKLVVNADVSATTYKKGIEQTDGSDVHIYDVEFDVSGGSTASYWTEIWNGAKLTVHNGIVIAAANGANIISGGELVLEGPQLVNDTFVLGGTRKGQWFDPNGKTVPSVDYPAEGRLTLTTGVPVTTSDVTGATTLYYTPYKGDKIALYDGASVWKTFQFTELSISLAGKTANLPYDVFIYDNSGTPALELLAWSTATARATALAYQNGILVKSGATTRRYLGAIRINSTGGQTNHTLTQRFVSNYYNQVPFKMVKTQTGTHSYTTASFRYWNNDATSIIEFFQGVQENAIEATLAGRVISTGNFGTLAIGIDGSSTNYDNNTSGAAVSGEVRVGIALTVEPLLGYHFLSMIEFGAAGCQFGATTLWGYINA